MLTLKAPRRASRSLAAATLSVAMFGAQLAAAAPVEIDFWDQIWGPQAYIDTAQKMVEEFNASQSEIHVTYRSVPWSGWYETYVTAIASGSAPDVSTGGGFQAVNFAALGEIYPVDELIEAMKADGSISEFDPRDLEAMYYDGHYVALPWALDMRTIWARTDILEKKGVAIPTTWDEFHAASKAVTGDGTYGFVSNGGPSGVHMIMTAAINNGGGLFDTEGKAALDRGRTLEALQWLESLARDGGLNPASAGYQTNDSIASIQRGESTFILFNPGLRVRIGDAADKVAQIPPLKGPHGDVGTTVFVNNIMVYKQSEHPKEALTFLRWWSENALRLWTEGGVGSLPARKSIRENAHFTSNADIMFAVEHYLPIAKTMAAPVGGTFPELNTIDGDGFLRSLAEKLWQGVPAAEAVVDAQAHLQEIMGE